MGDSPAEVITELLNRLFGPDNTNHPEDADHILTALREAGWELYRPEEVDETVVASELKDGSGYCWFGYIPAGIYRLIPVETPCG